MSIFSSSNKKTQVFESPAELFIPSLSTKTHIRLWLCIIGCSIVLKIVSVCIFGFNNSFSIAVSAFFGGIILSVIMRNIINFAIGVVIAILCEYSFELYQGLL